MKVSTAFDTYQTTVNAIPMHVKEARARRDVFCRAFGTLSDVKETLPSGSLARGTQRDPIHDVDLIMVFDTDDHPGWDSGAGTAAEALEYTRGQVSKLLGVNGGTFDQRVRHTLLRNHVVKCFLDDPDDPDAFAVEVMPALRVPAGLRVPERINDQWVLVNPEHLKRLVAARHAEWRYFAPMVRVLKAWKDHAGLDMKSLVIEVLALEQLPRPGLGELTRQQALARFFTAARVAVMNGVRDPANLCGEIQPSLDRAAVAASMAEAADVAARALAAEARGDDDRAVCLWRSIFGPQFPEPFGGCSGLLAGVGSGAAALAPAVIRPRVKEAPQG